MIKPEWYFDPASNTFVAFADGTEGCSRYDFAEGGQTTRRSPIRAKGPFAQAFRAELKSLSRIGPLENHLNIHEAHKRGR